MSTYVHMYAICLFLGPINVYIPLIIIMNIRTGTIHLYACNSIVSELELYKDYGSTLLKYMASSNTSHEGS